MLVDTSVWIDFFNGFASPEADRLNSAISDGETIALPGLVLTEILLGIRTEQEATKIQHLLEAFEFVDGASQTDYVESARIYRVCRTQGFTVRSTIDCLIAQLCLRDNRPILTKDRDFQVISQFFPLRFV